MILYVLQCFVFISFICYGIHERGTGNQSNYILASLVMSIAGMAGVFLNQLVQLWRRSTERKVMAEIAAVAGYYEYEGKPVEQITLTVGQANDLIKHAERKGSLVLWMCFIICIEIFFMYGLACLMFMSVISFFTGRG